MTAAQSNATAVPDFAYTIFNQIVAPLRYFFDVDCDLVRTLEMRCHTTIGERRRIVIDWTLVEEVVTWFRALEPQLVAYASDASSTGPDLVSSTDLMIRSCARRAFARGDYHLCKGLLAMHYRAKRAHRHQQSAHRVEANETHGFAPPPVYAFVLTFLVYHEWGHIFFHDNPELGAAYATRVLAIIRSFTAEDEDVDPIVAGLAYRSDILTQLDDAIARSDGEGPFAEEVFADHLGMAAAFGAARLTGLVRRREGLLLGILFGVPLFSDAFDIIHRRSPSEPSNGFVEMGDVNARWFVRAGPVVRAGLMAQDAIGIYLPWAISFGPSTFGESEAMQGYNFGSAPFFMTSFLNPMLQYYMAPSEEIRQSLATAPPLSLDEIDRLERRLRAL